MYSSCGLVRNTKHVYQSNCYISRFITYVFISRSFSNGTCFWDEQSISITLPLLIAITALSRFIILQGKEMDASQLLYESLAIVFIAIAIVVLRLRHSDKLGLSKKRK